MRSLILSLIVVLALPFLPEASAACGGSGLFGLRGARGGAYLRVGRPLRGERGASCGNGGCR